MQTYEPLSVRRCVSCVLSLKLCESTAFTLAHCLHLGCPAGGPLGRVHPLADRLLLCQHQAMGRVQQVLQVSNQRARGINLKVSHLDIVAKFLIANFTLKHLSLYFINEKVPN